MIEFIKLFFTNAYWFVGGSFISMILSAILMGIIYDFRNL